MRFIHGFLFIFVVTIILVGSLSVIGLAAFITAAVLRGDGSSLEKVIFCTVATVVSICVLFFMIALMRGAYSEYEELRRRRSTGGDLPTPRRQLLAAISLVVGISLSVAGYLMTIAGVIKPQAFFVAYGALFLVLTVGVLVWILTKWIAEAKKKLKLKRLSVSRETTETILKRGSAKDALSVLGAIIAFVVIGAVVKSVMRAPRERETVSKDEKFLEQLQTDATKKHPGIPLSQGMQQEASERATKKLTSEADEVTRAINAAAMFWGFFFVNARERPEFCREQGGDIQPFVKAFERAHANEIAKARSIYARVPADEEKRYISLKLQMRKALVQDMNDIATSNKISIKEVCQMLSDNADSLVQEWHLSKVQPMVFKVLTSAK